MKINDLKVFKGFIKVNYCDWYPISSIKCISLHNQYKQVNINFYIKIYKSIWRRCFIQ